jgi:hypothetical protein
MSRSRIAVFSLAFVLCACAVGADDGPNDPGNQAAVDGAKSLRQGSGPLADLRSCSAQFTPARAAGWRHFSSRIVSALGAPIHSANDVIVQPGQAATIETRLAYGGILNKELENEWVWVFVDDCTSWRYVGYALTSGEGRATFRLPAGLPAGRYDVRVEVVGDATSVPLTLWILPAGTHVAIFDLDGTLTTDDTQLFQQILLGDVPDAYPAGPDLTWAEAVRGEVPVYLTGRPEMLAGLSRSWLASLGFAPGALHLARTAGEVLPTTSGVGNYKLAFLRALASSGFVVDDAFGNATTDVYAYAGAGVPEDRTWIIGPNAGAGGTQGVTDSWAHIAAELAAEPPVDQPFHL